MTEITQIIATQSDTLSKMKAKSVLALSDSPSADGVNANMIKNSFVDPLWDGDASVVGEIKRVCGQINSAFTIVKNAIETNEANIQINVGSIAEVKESLTQAKSDINGEISNAKTRLSNNEDNIQAVVNRAAALEDRATEVEALAAENKLGYEALQRRATTLETKTGTLESRATAIETDCASLWQKTNKLEEDIKNCEVKGDAINFSYSSGKLTITKG